MRIIAGSLGGRIFPSPRGHRTHPMSDKARGGLFNSLGDIKGLSFLDTFAGTGAIGFEAISRGAEFAVLIDIDRSAFSNMKQAAEELGIDKKVKVTKANISSWSNNNPDTQFDIVVLDPPHDDLQLQVIQKLTRHSTPSGRFILSWPGKAPLPPLEGLALQKANGYGDIQLGFYTVDSFKPA